MQNTPTIGFIGAGNITYALVSGLIGNKFPAKYIKLSDPNVELLSARANEFKVRVFEDNNKLALGCDVIVLAVKPQILPAVCKALQIHISHNPLIISIVAGVKITNINHWLGGNATIVRAMPNTPAFLKQGATGMVAIDTLSNAQKLLSEKILGSVGLCLWVKSEAMLDAVTALSGSGPAYFFLLIESMTKAGIELGLDAKTAQQLSTQTAFGASMMVHNSGESAATLRARVSSKKGTTQAAIQSFQAQNFESVVATAMRAAFERAREMGIESDNNKK